jgi:hypothetical protein
MNNTHIATAAILTLAILGAYALGYIVGSEKPAEIIREQVNVTQTEYIQLPCELNITAQAAEEKLNLSQYTIKNRSNTLWLRNESNRTRYFPN